MDYMQPDLFAIAEGEADMESAYQWKRENEAIYRAMVNRARTLAGEGKRVAIDELFNWARYSLHWGHDPSDFKLNNNLRAPLARIMCREYAVIAEHMETREARCDTALGVMGL